MANEITGAYSAKVNGKPTALAGCAVGNCPRAQRCLRADPLLAMRHPHNCGAEGQFFIPIAPEMLEALTRLSDQCERLRLPGQRQTDAEANALAVIAKATQ